MTVERVKRNRVGDAMLAYMAREGFWSVCVFDGCMTDIACDLDLKLWKGMNPHPMNRSQVAASYLARDDRFEIKHIRAHDTRSRSRLLRLYVAKEAVRAETSGEQP